MIEVNHLVYKYPKSPHLTIKDISFKIEKGEIFGFLGPSGAGKSTTQKILIKLLSGFEGSINILNKNLTEWDKGFYEKIGVCFELPNHYLKLSAIENLKFFASFYSKKVMDPMNLLEIIGLREDAHVKTENYSKGMKMRLNFIRSIMHDPDILFLDEPTSGLDPVNARKVKDIIIDQQKQGKTIFITTHNMHDADELCNRVGFIIDGKLEIIDAPKNLKLLDGKRSLTVDYINGETKTKEFPLDGLGDNMEFINLLRNHHINSIHSKEATLDDVFIKVTGKKLSE